MLLFPQPPPPPPFHLRLIKSNLATCSPSTFYCNTKLNLQTQPSRKWRRFVSEGAWRFRCNVDACHIQDSILPPVLYDVKLRSHFLQVRSAWGASRDRGRERNVAPRLHQVVVESMENQSDGIGRLDCLRLLVLGKTFQSLTLSLSRGFFLPRFISSGRAGRKHWTSTFLCQAVKCRCYQCFVFCSYWLSKSFCKCLRKWPDDISDINQNGGKNNKFVWSLKKGKVKFYSLGLQVERFFPPLHTLLRHRWRHDETRIFWPLILGQGEEGKKIIHNNLYFTGLKRQMNAVVVSAYIYIFFPPFPPLRWIGLERFCGFVCSGNN